MSKTRANPGGGIRILGMGKCLPARCVTNEDLTEYVDTSDAWIRERTGIRTRYYSTTETHLDLAATAAQRALERTGIRPDQIGLCIVATISADYATPSAACLVQERLGLPGDIPAFDLNAACTGFLYALNTASALLATPSVHRPYALVIGAEQLTRMLNMEDRSTCILFGDGAAAAVVEADDSARFVCRLGSQGDVHALNTPGLMRREPYIHMDGRAVFRFATMAMERSIRLIETESGVCAKDMDYIICHQANERILAHVQKRMGLTRQQVYRNLDRYGNTSGASIPLALADLDEEGLLHAGSRLILSGFGSGLTWAGAYMEF